MPPTGLLETCDPPAPTVAAVVATEFGAVVTVWKSVLPLLSHPI